jgi:hypothetical protein
MSFNLDRQYIEQFFIDNLDANLRFDGQDYQDHDLPFVGVMVEPLSRENATVDNQSQVTDGMIRCRVFVERDQGTKELLELCDLIASTIDNQSFDSIVTYAADAPKELNTEDLYLAKEISIPYYSDS